MPWTIIATEISRKKKKGLSDATYFGVRQQNLDPEPRVSQGVGSVSDPDCMKYNDVCITETFIRWANAKSQCVFTIQRLI